MGILDDLSDGFAKLDPTNDKAEFADEVRKLGDATLMFLTDGASGPAFSTAAKGIGELNQATDNTLTLNNIRDEVDDWFSSEETGHESKLMEEPSHENPEPDSGYEEPDSGYIPDCGFAPDC